MTMAVTQTVCHARQTLRTIIAVMLITLAPAGTFTQQSKALAGQEKDLIPQRVAFTYNTASSYASHLVTLIEYLKIAFNVQTQTVFAYENPDVVFELDAVKSGSSINLIIRGTRTDTKAVVLEKTAAFPNLALGTVSKFLTDIAQEAGRLLPPLPQKEKVVITEKVVEKTETVQVARGVIITFEGTPGTVIEFLNLKKKVTIPETGTYALEQLQNTSVKFRARAPGYMPLEKTIFAGKDDFTVVLTLERLPSWEFAGTVRYANLVPGLHVRFYTAPGFIFYDAGFESSAIALIPFVNAITTWYEASAGAGILLEDPLAFLSMDVLLSLSCRLENASGTIRLPSVLPFALNLNLSSYFKITSKIRLSLGSAFRLADSPILPYTDTEMIKYTTNAYLKINEKFNLYAEPFAAIRISL